MSALPNFAEVEALIRETAEREILPRFQKLAEGDIREKKPGDFVTIADEGAERYLAPRLQALMPQTVVVGEEEVAVDPTVLERLKGEGTAWVIDPIDGTANFAAGRPIFAVMVGFVRNGEVLAGWIYDPPKRRMATTERGAGAWFDDGTRLAVEKPEGRGTANNRLIRRLGKNSHLVDPHGFDYRCAGHEYLALCTGRAHYVLHSRLYPWDHVAGELMHREAGGYSARLDGELYSPRIFDGGLLLTPDRESWRTLRAALNPPST